MRLIWFPDEDWADWWSMNARPVETGGWVYRIHALVDHGGGRRFREIPRCAGVDPNGILYIGSTRDARPGRGGWSWFRIEMLVRWIATGRPCKHGFVIDWHRFPAFGEAFPRQQIAISLAPETSPRQRECAELVEYRCNFGELPPLNGAH